MARQPYMGLGLLFPRLRGICLHLLLKCKRRLDHSVGIVTRQQNGRRMDCGLIPGKDKTHYLPQNIQTVSGTLLTSY
jgi:hypothetical protein